MATGSSAQIPVGGCQLCETGAKIRWKCFQCKLLMCDKCTEKIHIKIAKDHEVIDISNIGTIRVATSEFKVVKEYMMGMKNILLMCFCPDGSLWIGDHHPGSIMHVVLRPDDVSEVSSFNIKVDSMAMSAIGQLHIVSSDGELKFLDEPKGTIKDTCFTINHVTVLCAHISKEGRMMLCVKQNSKCALMVFNDNDKISAKYETYNGSQLFEKPKFITSGTQGQIYIADLQKHRMVIIKSAEDISFYDGHPEINSAEKPLNPSSILRMPSDNVLLLDYGNFCLHVLNSDGLLIADYYLRDQGIRGAYSLAVAPSGKLYIGCCGKTTDPPGTKAKLYEVECPGI